MMHTYLDRDADTAREVAREPMKGYLGTAVGLLRDVASAFPTFAGRGKGTDDLFKSLSPEEMDQLLEVAAHRYLGTSGLFGTPDDAAAIVEAVSAAGVDEVACLVDFGIDTDDVLASLDLLLRGQGRRRRPPRADADRRRRAERPTTTVDDTVAALVARHGVTHLQCTPSLAAMLVADPADRDALGTVAPPDARRRGAADGAGRRAARAAARPLHQHVRADRDDDLVADPRDRRPRRRRRSRSARRSPTRRSSCSTPTAAGCRSARSASCTSAARASPAATTTGPS